MDKNYDTGRLNNQNKFLKIACVIMGLIIFYLFTLADRPSLIIYQDMSVQYDPGIGWDKQKHIYAYPSEDLENTIELGFYDEETDRVYSLSWLIYAENKEEIKQRNQSATQEDWDRIYRDLGFDSPN